MNRTFTLDDYKGLLAKFHCFYSAIEPTLPVEDLKANGFDVEPRRKTPLLERDLSTLGINSNGSKWDRIPNLDTTAKAFGSIYVMEGATLGGQVITRQLKEHLGLTPESGGAFFYSYGPNVGPMWKEFGSIITAFAEKENDDDAIVDSAKATFDSFRLCFADEAAA
jgi:heme oxygenase